MWVYEGCKSMKSRDGKQFWVLTCQKSPPKFRGEERLEYARYQKEFGNQMALVSLRYHHQATGTNCRYFTRNLILPSKSSLWNLERGHQNNNRSFGYRNTFPGSVSGLTKFVQSIFLTQRLSNVFNLYLRFNNDIIACHDRSPSASPETIVD